jgi:hypothetical protein
MSHVDFGRFTVGKVPHFLALKLGLQAFVYKQIRSPNPLKTQTPRSIQKPTPRHTHTSSHTHPSTPQNPSQKSTQTNS